VLDEADLPDTYPISFESEPSTAAVDAAKVERIIENLLFNATRHTPEGTPISLSVRPAEGGVLIRVEDEGPGVPAEMREIIFEPFRQSELHPSRGAGIGLSLVASFAEMHGGRAWAEEGAGGGAVFLVFLPEHRR